LSQIKNCLTNSLLSLVIFNSEKTKISIQNCNYNAFLTTVPIGATQLGWHLYGKQVGFDYGMIAGTFAVILAGYLMYEKGWRNEDEDED